jgi:putative Mn2+ efflux pump MntP
VVVGGVTYAISAAGFYSGRRIGSWLGRWADFVGGLVLIGLGLRILLTHIL